MLPTADQFEAIKRFFESRGLDPKCYICGADNWEVEDILPPVEEGGVRLMRRGAAAPLVQLECRNCGHVVYFNAITIGLHQSELV